MVLLQHAEKFLELSRLHMVRDVDGLRRSRCCREPCRQYRRCEERRCFIPSTKRPLRIRNRGYSTGSKMTTPSRSRKETLNLSKTSRRPSRLKWGNRMGAAIQLPG